MKHLLVLLYCFIAVMGDAEINFAQFPFIVLIKQNIKDNKILSTGTLVSLSWVLTSSIEMFKMRDNVIEPGSIVVYANITSYNDLSSAHARNVSNIQAEPGQNSDDEYPNLVLLLLNEPFPKVSNQINFVQINNGRLDWTCVLVGWGRNTESKKFAPNAWFQNSVPFTAKQCASKFSLIEFPSQMCIRTSTQTNWTATAGSPLICSGVLTAIKHIDTYFTQSSYRISVFVRLRAFTTWIEGIAQDIPALVNLKSGVDDEEDDYREPWLDISTRYPARRILVPVNSSADCNLDFTLITILSAAIFFWYRRV